MQIDPTANSLAIAVGNVTGLDPKVVLAQWQAEQGVDNVQKDWFYFNPAGITPGNPNVDKFANPGADKKGFLTFPTAVQGADAYAELILTDPSYSNVRAAAASHNPQQELQALVDSPWDSGHYTANGVKGAKLFNAYNVVANASLSPNASSVMPQDGTTQNAADIQGGNNMVASKLKEWLGLPQSLTGKDLVILLVGIILIILFAYRMFTK